MYSEANSPRFHDIVPKNAVLERVSHGHILTEGPVWSARESALYWTDIIGNTIWKWNPGVGKNIVLRPSGKANGLTFDKEGRLVVAGWSNRTVWRMALDGSITPLSTHYRGKKLGTPNDIVVKSDGAIYFTDPPGGLGIVEMEGEDLQQYLEYSGVYRLNAETGELTLLTDEVPGCNGLVFSPDESLHYINDTGGRYIEVYDVQDDGNLKNSRRFVDVVGDEPGNPDGMKVDIEGHVFCTGPAGIHVFDPSESYLGRLKVPEACSNMAWGDADWKTLYIT
ncbi:MAG: SMP-30/gluconolactonase/LRE family protein, partial [Deltaproteobacteria bacterium]|nr:SMP-30/gluconolactonase/LRE family protein [Deltaproteobacteria bacterium]